MRVRFEIGLKQTKTPALLLCGNSCLSVAFRCPTQVEATNANVEGALAEISKYYNTVSSDRWLMMKIFGILLAFFIFFIVVIA